MTSHVAAPTRRTVIRAAAWTAPVVTIAAAAPAFAASEPLQGAIMTTLLRKYSDKDLKHVEWQLTLTNTGGALTNPIFEFFFEDNAGQTASSFTILGGENHLWSVETDPVLKATYNGTIPADTAFSVTVDFVGPNNAGGSVGVKVYDGVTLVASGTATF